MKKPWPWLSKVLRIVSWMFLAPLGFFVVAWLVIGMFTGPLLVLLLWPLMGYLAVVAPIYMILLALYASKGHESTKRRIVCGLGSVGLAIMLGWGLNTLIEGQRSNQLGPVMLSGAEVQSLIDQCRVTSLNYDYHYHQLDVDYYTNANNTATNTNRTTKVDWGHIKQEAKKMQAKCGGNISIQEIDSP